MKLLKTELVEVEGGGVCRSAWPTARQHENNIEELDRVQETKCDGEQDDWRKLRQSHIDEGLQWSNAIELGRLIKMGRDRCKSSEQDDEYERGPLPDISDDDRNVDPRRFSNPAYRDGIAEKLAQKIVRGTKGPLQEQRPGLPDDDRTDEQRYDQNRHDDPPTPEGLDHSERQRQAQDKFYNDDRE